jgi:cytoskeleton protein RodZ
MTETTGQQLKQARESKGISIEQVAEELHIRERYLLALENDNPAQIPSEIQAKGFLKLYAEHLDITLMPSGRVIEKSTTAIDNDSEPFDEASGEKDSEDATFGLFGKLFFEKRQQLEKDFDDIHNELRINATYLAAIEQENMAQLPPASQAKGMIERYAEYLGLDRDEVLELYADILIQKQADGTSSTEKKKRAARKVDGVKQFITPDLIIGFVLIAIILFIGFLSIRQIMQTRTDIAAVSTAEAISTDGSMIDETPLSTEAEDDDVTENEELVVQVPTATLPVILPQDGEQPPQTSRLIVQMVANQRAYLRVIADDEIVFEGRVLPGNIYEFFGDREISVVTGNASAFDITLIQDNQTTQLGRMGLVGEILDITFQPDTIITPTPLPTQTPTITNTPQITVTPTATPEPAE